MWGKVMLFETCDRVPLVIRVPKSVERGATTAGSTSQGLVELVDLFPTLAELCGVAPPIELQGRSIVPMLRDPSSDGREFAYTVVTRGKKLGKAIRTPRFRYTLWPTGEELYDLQNDIEEHDPTNAVAIHQAADIGLGYRRQQGADHVGARQLAVTQPQGQTKRGVKDGNAKSLPWARGDSGQHSNRQHDPAVVKWQAISQAARR